MRRLIWTRCLKWLCAYQWHYFKFLPSRKKIVRVPSLHLPISHYHPTGTPVHGRKVLTDTLV